MPPKTLHFRGQSSVIVCVCVCVCVRVCACKDAAVDADPRRAEERGQSSLGRRQLGDGQRPRCERRGRWRRSTGSLHPAASAAGGRAASAVLGRPPAPPSAAAVLRRAAVVVAHAAFSSAAAVRPEADGTGRRRWTPPLPDVDARHGPLQGTEHDARGGLGRGGDDDDRVDGGDDTAAGGCEVRCVRRASAQRDVRRPCRLHAAAAARATARRRRRFHLDAVPHRPSGVAVDIIHVVAVSLHLRHHVTKPRRMTDWTGLPV